MATKKIVLVTGGNRGIGFEVCRQLADLGYRVMQTARTQQKAMSAVQRLAAPGRTLEPLALEVNSLKDAKNALKTIQNLHGRLDGLVNNAAIDYDTDQRVLTADLDRVRRVFETNTLSVWQLTQTLLPLLKKSASGRIVNVSSSAGAWDSLRAGTPAYSLSKVGLNALTIMMADALQQTNILVNAICPGWVATDMGGPGGGPVDKGAKSVIWGITLPNDGPRGGFFRHGKAISW
ncbi:MAG: SDR family NAD(P)-dependent oxidoreductase [Bacteroidota bacterium]